jgi:hypothetical protein
MAYHKNRKDQAAEPPVIDLPVVEEMPAATEAAAASGS